MNSRIGILLFTLLFVNSDLKVLNEFKKTDESSSNAVCNLPQSLIEEIKGYQDVTNSIIKYFTEGPYKGKLWESLADFVDKFGARYCGTQSLEDAIDFLVDVFEQNNLENVTTENVDVPFWQRGQESAVLLKPRQKPLPMYGLGLSVATPPEGITAKAIVVRSFEELDALSDDEVNGKIIVYNQPFTEYFETGLYRMFGASRAAKKGASAALIRSVTPFSLATPHAGILMYEANVTQIPAAAITLEDAEQLWRMQKRGDEIIIKLIMPAKLEQKVSRNIYADLRGSAEVKKVVLISGHIDSWDVGEGAMDNGGGSFIAWTALAALKQMNLRPRRTLRTIMWTAEELGINGYEKYFSEHEASGEYINMAMDSDLGTFRPKGVIYSGSASGECIMREILKLFESINATDILVQSSNQFNETIPLVGLLNANEKYFWYHHTPADSMAALDPGFLDLCAAFWTAFSYIVADISQDIPRI